MLRRISRQQRVALLAVFIMGSASAQEGETSLTVKVRDRAGAAVAGATVAVAYADAEDASSDATTDDEGAIRFGVAPGRYLVSVRADGFVDRVRAAVAVDAATHETVVLSLFPGAAVSGRIQDKSGEPVEGAELCLQLQESRTYPLDAVEGAGLERGKTCVESDSEGNVSTAVLPIGNYELRIEAPDLVTRVSSFRHERAPRAQTWVLKAGGVVRGRLEDREEQPVPDARLHLRHRELETVRESVTDAEGQIRVGGLAAGYWNVRIEPPNGAILLRDGIAVDEGRTMNLGTLRVRPGLDIAGWVLDANGEPVAGAKISVRDSGKYTRRMRRLESDDEGRFLAAGLREEAVNLLVEAPEGYASTAVEEVMPPERDLRIELDEAGRVCGTVTTESGEIPRDARISTLLQDEGFLSKYAELTSSAISSARCARSAASARRERGASAASNRSPLSSQRYRSRPCGLPPET